MMRNGHTMMYFILYEIFQGEGPEKMRPKVSFYLKNSIEYEIHHITCIARLFMIIDNFHGMIMVIMYKIFVFMDNIFLTHFMRDP